jgi:7,8-dihydroneopterin 2',3'-cyclic phosphate phosphodiesterase
MVDKIQDKALCRKVSDLLDGLSIEIEGVKHDGLPLAEAPAGISRHHNYPGGLLEHTLSSANIALAMCDCVEKIYGGKIDRDYVISGILLHDICKCLTYRVREDGTYTSSPLGERANHMLLITSELVRRDFPLDLIHIVAAHHGRHGLVSPRTVEALIVYLADMLDAQFNGEIIRLARGLIREAACPAPDKIDSETALKIIHSKVTDGWEGLRMMMEKANQDCASENCCTKEIGKW